ncbi:DUF1622 domain-containing protein [Microvirga splendida]|uniref:DUF1622 domain-containing protein n=1 Tax=Microvirga splendida TaxID=2795727 RepID=A0ABS0Y0I1_9HYPH|nr:DUF1622 domain-containing protein [Microvirga splendida]MBJ6125822.1 DUF1622 domain-containing protein [Microvirga splendida]
MEESFSPALHLITRAIEIGGIAVIVLGLLGATIAVLWQVLQGRSGLEAFGLYRSNVGRAILLGLEFLVAADIINTVAIDPTLQSLLVLGGIVLIRTFLSFSLEVEIEGRWPWDRHKGESERSSSRSS